MKRALLLAAILVGCNQPAESKSTTTNNAFQVEKLFTHEGCTVYRFTDARTVYYVRCGSTVTLNEDYKKGKTTEESETLTVEGFYGGMKPCTPR